MSAVQDARRTRDGDYVVPADELRVGDRLVFTTPNGRRQVLITAIEEKPKTRVLTVAPAELTPWTERLRRTTLIARAPREGEDDG